MAAEDEIDVAGAEAQTQASVLTGDDPRGTDAPAPSIGEAVDREPRREPIRRGAIRNDSPGLSFMSWSSPLAGSFTQ